MHGGGRRTDRLTVCSRGKWGFIRVWWMFDASFVGKRDFSHFMSEQSYMDSRKNCLGDHRRRQLMDRLAKL
jgi:hypothetical protein